MKITIPDFSLVVLIGASGSGKSTFARAHFKPTEILNSDFFRGLISDDEGDQTISKDAFEALHYIAAKRLAHRRLTVVDATNVQSESRKPLVALARKFHALLVAIVLDMPEELCWRRTQERPDRNFGKHVVVNHVRDLRRSLKRLPREGFKQIHHLRSVEEMASVVIERQRLWTDRRDEHGPFDIIGDVHGCADELETLLEKLGYREDAETAYRHPEGRKAVFLGDIVDRGPRILDTYRIVRKMVVGGEALCVPGNHEVKLVRKLSGRDVRVAHGLEKTLAEIEALPEEERRRLEGEMLEFFRALVGHYLLDDGKLVVAHAGMKEEMQGRASAKVREFALYGETTGETDEFGLPVRYDWASEYRGRAIVVYGHTPVPEAEWINRTIDIDTGCVFGGKLTALRYPEGELVSVPAARVYTPPVRPFPPADRREPFSAREDEGLLRIEDVMGKRVVTTRLRGRITIREENAIAALEVMSRFAVDPRWLIYLPPTMSPSETSQRPDFLEHPEDAFLYYRNRGVPIVVCEEKHMGSRAVVVVCRDEDAARRRFGISQGGIGVCYTRTGRPFFADNTLEAEFLERVRAAIEQAGWWEKFASTWVCLDCELMPWSAKAQELLRQQYAAVGAASRASLAESIHALEEAAPRCPDLLPLLDHYREKLRMAKEFVAAYRNYCWPVEGLKDLKLAPFHLMATENAVHTDKDHLWHMERVAELCRHDVDLLLPTPHRVIDVTDPESYTEGIGWWEELTQSGGEGIVIKPLEFIARGTRGLIQPAIKSRGRAYLRIIYGPEYTSPEHLERLRDRGLSTKRSLALREFALGVEALERFCRNEPLYRVHECVFGVLALESEPVDPRL